MLKDAECFTHIYVINALLETARISGHGMKARPGS